uniref:Uncharacterized protein n=1 Tax=Avena sativa TaxID=4498 RepID=A0ACD5TPM1_AVESA
MATMAPTGTLPAGKPRMRANRPLEPAKGKPAPSAKILREADDQSPERKRKIPPAADPPETNKKKKKKEKTRSPSAETKKTSLPLEHAWTPGDEVRILEAMAAHRQDEQGKLPKTSELFDSLDGRLDSKGFSMKELRRKVRSLKRRHGDDAIKGGVPAEEHECRLYQLSQNVWGTIPEPVTTSGLEEPAPTIPEPAATSGGGGDAGAMVPDACETFDEMRERYPCLAHEVEHIVDEPAVLEKLLLGIDCSKACALNSKINGLREELTQAITESAKMQNIQVPKGWQCPCNKLPPAKSKATNPNLLYLDRLDKMQGFSERMNREMLKMRQDIMASPNV